jgi:phospholipid/cholesterol/gamma-HCH transport system substrate-binding protein
MARDASVGIVVTLAFVIFAVGIFAIGDQTRLWTSKVSYKLQVRDANGLNHGSPVTLAGVQVGTVTRIELPPDPTIQTIDVEFSVDTAIQGRIRADSTASLKILTMLGGDKFVEITSGSADQPLLPPGSYVRVPDVLDLGQLGEIGANIAEDLGKVTASLSVILAQLQERSTVIGQALFDPNFGRTSLGNIAGSIESIHSILEKVDSGSGLAGHIVSDERFAAEILARVEGTLVRMEVVMARLTEENGAFMRMTAPDGPLSRLADNLDTSTDNLARITGEMGEGRGVAGRLLGDDVYAEEVLDNLRQATRDLRDVVGKINRGEGTAGALINDPEIYQDLRDVLRGVKESKLISWMIRRYRQKGEDARIREMKERRKLMEVTEEGDA